MALLMRFVLSTDAMPLDGALVQGTAREAGNKQPVEDEGE